MQFPKPSLPVIVVNGFLMLATLVLAPACFALHWDQAPFLGTLLGPLCLSFFLVAYGALFRRRAWLAEGAATLGAAPALLGALAWVLQAVVGAESQNPWRAHGGPVTPLVQFIDAWASTGWVVGLGIAAAIVGACIWGWRVNSRWAKEIAAWERDCLATGGADRETWAAHAPFRFSLAELMLFTLLAAVIAGISRAMLVSD